MREGSGEKEKKRKLNLLTAQDQSVRGQPMKGEWDSIHVVQVTDSKTNANYKLTSTVLLSVATATDSTGHVNLSGSLTRQVLIFLTLNTFIC